MLYSVSSNLDPPIHRQRKGCRNGRRDIFNMEQGSQFTSGEFTGALKKNEIQIGMDGMGCWRDNVFVERLCALSSTDVNTLRSNGINSVLSDPNGLYKVTPGAPGKKLIE